MSEVIAFVLAHKAASALVAAFMLSEVLPELDKPNANSVSQLVVGLVKASLRGAVKAALAILPKKEEPHE